MDQRLTEPAGGASVDWRGRCEELADALACHYPGHVDDVELVNRVRADLAAEADGPAVRRREPASVVGELSYELVAQWMAEVWHEGTPVRVAASDLHLASRAAEWGARFGRQPAPPAAGADGELVAWLAGLAVRAADCRQPKAAGMLTWAAQVVSEHADPVDRQAAPVPVSERLPELRGMFERILCVARSSDQKPVGNIELADRLIKAVVSWGASGAALAVKPVGEVE